MLSFIQFNIPLVHCGTSITDTFMLVLHYSSRTKVIVHYRRREEKMGSVRL